MIQLPCPWCGPRNVTEFRHHGEVVARPEVSTTTPEQWRRFLYLRDNPCGPVTETWYHVAGCRAFFSVRRDTLTNETEGMR